MYSPESVARPKNEINSREAGGVTRFIESGESGEVARDAEARHHSLQVLQDEPRQGPTGDSKLLCESRVYGDRGEYTGGDVVGARVRASARRIEVASDEDRARGVEGLKLGTSENERRAKSALCIRLVVKMRVQ